jgi:WG containing repeat
MVRSEISQETWPRSPRGLIDRSGTVIIPPVWADACTFSEGRAVVCTGGSMKPNAVLGRREVLSDRKYGYLDRMGRLVISGEYDLAYSFSEGLAVVQIGDGICRARYGYIDANGNRIIPLTLTSATSFKDGMAIVRRRGRKWREVSVVINPAGQVVLEVPLRGLEPFSEGLAAASAGDTYAFIDIEGRRVIGAQFDQVAPFENGLAEVQRGDWYGLIDKAGHFVWGPATEGAVNRVVDSEWTS